jgi:hypothetical protein
MVEDRIENKENVYDAMLEDEWFMNRFKIDLSAIMYENDYQSVDLELPGGEQLYHKTHGNYKKAVYKFIEKQIDKSVNNKLSA